MPVKYRILIFLATICCTPAFAQKNDIRDTLRLDIHDAEARFLRNNLQLLLQKYSVDSATAGIVTAKLYDNPEFDFSSGFYQPQTKKLFDYSNDNREIAMQLSQLVKTAGKRNKNIAIAKTGVVLGNYQFFDLMRTLKYTLRNDFYNIYYLQQTQKVYDIEISSLQKTVAAYNEEVQKGNIAPKDLLRIQSQLYTLQAELADLQGNMDDVQSEFKLLIRAGSMDYVMPVVNDAPSMQPPAADIPLQTFIDSAYRNRYDLKAAQTAILLNKQNLSLQKALAVPDITLNLSYDRLGSYVNDYNGIGIGIPLPIFNRNQGGIQQARIGVKSSETQLESTQDALESEIANAYLGALRAEKLLGSFDPSFEVKLGDLITNVTGNFSKHNLSILEFIDFYDAYKQNIVQLNTLRYSRMSQLEQLNYTTGTSFFNK